MAVYLAAGDPRVPWYAKATALAVAAYALSPLDLIPDFIPIVGYLDDLVLLPLGVALVIRMIPRDVWAECRSRALAGDGGVGKRAGLAGAALIAALWAGAILWVVRALAR